MTSQHINSVSILVLVLPVLLVFVQLTAAIKCFECLLQDGVGDPGCGDNPPPDKYLRECTTPQCWYRYQGNGSASVERNCSSTVASMTGCVSAVVSNAKITNAYMECKCSTDGCNGKQSSSVTVSNNGAVSVSTNVQSNNVKSKMGGKKVSG